MAENEERCPTKKQSFSLKRSAFYRASLFISTTCHTKRLYETQILMKRELNNWVYPTESSSAMIRQLTFSKVRRSKSKNYEGRPKCRSDLGKLHSSTAGYNSCTINDITEFQDCSININKNATNIFAVWYLNLQK